MKTKGSKAAKNRGQSVVEFALVFPIVMLIFAGVFEFGLYFWAAHTVQNASREGVRFASVLNSLEVNDARIAAEVNEVLPETGLLTGVNITSTVPDCEVEDQVNVTVTGTYKFVFLKIIGINDILITHPTLMRYEGC